MKLKTVTLITIAGLSASFVLDLAGGGFNLAEAMLYASLLFFLVHLYRRG